ncbi:MAG TPA: hypothetical protein VFM83_03210 [Gaiellaceae bacterium]|nr:hypothetical protein [Gaiellaceae bacterium]
MTGIGWLRWTALAGVGFVVLYLAGNAVSRATAVSFTLALRRA